MQLQISAGGTPADVRTALERQVQQPLAGRELRPGQPELAEAIITYATRQLATVPEHATVSVAGHVSISVSASTPAAHASQGAGAVMAGAEVTTYEAPGAGAEV